MADINSTAFNENDSDNNTVNQPSWPENQSPSTVNDAARALQGALKRFYNRINATQTSTGTSDHYVLTFGISPVELIKGDRYAFIVHETNVGGSYLQINSLPSYPILVGGSNVSAGMLYLNAVADVCFDGTQWQLLNPHASAGGDISATSLTTSGNLNVGGIAQVTGDLNVAQDIAATGNVSSVAGSMTGYSVASTTSVSGASLETTGPAVIGTNISVGGFISRAQYFFLDYVGGDPTLNFANNTYIAFRTGKFRFVINGTEVGAFPP